MTIRTLTASDVKEYLSLRLAALHEQPPAFGTTLEEEETLTVEAMASRLESAGDSYVLGAYSDEQLVGIVRFSRYKAANEKHRGYIAGLYVRQDCRGQGLARALVTEVLARAGQERDLRRIHLTVVTAQTAAIRLYESLGFRIYGTEREAFSSGGQFFDEYLMELLLPPTNNQGV